MLDQQSQGRLHKLHVFMQNGGPVFIQVASLAGQRRTSMTTVSGRLAGIRIGLQVLLPNIPPHTSSPFMCAS
jgi:hypothetical protein